MRGWLLFLLVVLPVFVAGATIGFFNGQPVRFNYLVGEMELPLIALLVAEFLLVAVLTVALVALRVLSLKTEVRGLRKQLRDAESELKNLRALPLKDA